MKTLGTALKFIKEAYYYTWDRLAHFIRTSELFPDSWDPAQDAKKVMPIRWTIRSDKDVNFIAALVQNAKTDANLTGFSGNKGIIRRIKVQSDQDLDWDIFLWKTDTFDDVDLDLDSFCGRYKFSAAQGEQIAGANQYYYDSGPMELEYEDLDGTSELHVSVVNRNAVAKIAGANGELIVDVEYEPSA
jgi:hypothetical protein